MDQKLFPEQKIIWLFIGI